MKTSLKLTVLFVLLTSISVAQGIYNNGGKIVIGTGAVVHINGSTGNFRNETSGSNGEVLLSGSMIVKGNLTNNVASAGPFTNPAAGSEVILNGSAAQSLGGTTNAPFVFGKLTINNSSGIALGKNAQVNNLLSFQTGIISTDTNILTIGISGNVTGMSSTGYVSGKMMRVMNITDSSFVFPIGKGGNYRPLAINFSSLTGTSRVLAQQTESLLPGPPPPNITFFADRYWIISQTGGSDFEFKLTLDATGFSPSATKKMIKGDGTNNTDYDVSYSSPNYTNSAPFSSFSNFGIGEFCLPQVVTFTAIPAKTYGDAPFTVSATGGASGNPVIFTSSDTTVARCAGTNGTTITIFKAGNCTISAIQAGNLTYCQGRTDRVLTVNPKSIAIAADTGQRKVYGNADPARFTYTWSPTLVGSDTISGLMGRTAGENAAGYAFTIGTLSAGSNYALSVNATPVFTITPKPLTPVIVAAGKCYDGTVTASLTSQTLSGVISPDVVTLLVTTSVFADATAGTGKTVTASGLSLDGAGAPNYSLATATADTTADIYALPVPAITGPAKACPGSTGNIYSTATSMTNYVWTVSQGGSITSGGGTADDSVTVTWNTLGARSISVSYTNGLGCTASTATVKNVDVTTPPTPTISGPATACVNHTNKVYTTEGGNTNYVWALSAGGAITAGGTSADSSITVTWNTAGAQTVSVNYTSGSGCAAVSPTVRDVTVIASPVPAVSGPASICHLTSGNVYTTQPGMSSYVWTVSSGGTITTGGTSTDNTATITWDSTGAKSVSVNYQNADGCYGASPGVQNVTVKPLPVPTISGTSPVCGDMTSVDYSTEAGKTNYAWTLSSGGTITEGSGTRTITISWSTAGIHKMTVTYTDTNGCSAATPTEKTVGVGPLPVVTLSGPDTACVSNPGKVYKTESGKTNYAWSVATGGTITAGGTSSDSSATVTWNTAGARTISVNYQNEYGCSANNPTVKNVTAIAAPIPTVNGPASACSGSSDNVYVTQSGQRNYLWTVSPGGSIASGGTSIDDSVTVAWDTTGAQSVSVNFQNSSGCSGASAAVKNVTVNLSGQVNQPDSQIVCHNSTTAEVVFATTNTGGSTTYSWTNNATGIGLAASGTGNIDPFTAVNSGTSPVVATITVTPTYSNGGVSCIGTDKTFTITVDPIIKGNTSGESVSICHNSSTTLTGGTARGGSGSYAYLWESSNAVGGTYAAATGTNNAANYTTTALTSDSAQVYFRRIVTSGGCSDTAKPVKVTVYDNFTVGSAGSNQAICYNTAAAQLTGTAPTGGNTPYNYQWQISTNNSAFTDIGGATNLNFEPGTLAQTTCYRQKQGSSSDCGTLITDTVTVTVYPNFVRGSIASDQLICYNTPPAQLTGTAPTGGNTPIGYQWQISTNNNAFTEISGATTLNFEPGTLTQTTSYRQVQSSANSCGTLITDTVTVTVRTKFMTGAIKTTCDTICYNGDPSEIGNDTLASGGSGTISYQWQKSTAGAISAYADIAGATASSYDPPTGLTATTWYRRQAKEETCNTAFANSSGVWKVLVTPSTVGGAVAGGAQVCPGQNKTKLTLSGHTGTVQKWQSSTNDTTWTDIPDSTSVTFIATDIQVKTWFRAVVGSGICSNVNSSSAVITIKSNFKISGYAKYDNNPKTPINGIKVILRKGETLIDSMQVATNGFYQFTGLINGNYNLKIKSAHPSGQWQTWGGVNNTDYLLALRHATTGPLLPANPPVIRISGDVKAPQTPPLITTVDAEAIRYAAKYGWGSPKPYFDIPKWVFSGVTLELPIDNIAVNCLDVTRDIRALCAGDVNGTHLPLNGYKIAEPSLELVNRGTLPITKEITFPVRAERDMELGAITLMLDYDTAQIEITGVEMPDNGGEEPYFVLRRSSLVLEIGWMSLNQVNVAAGQIVLLINTKVKKYERRTTNDEVRMQFTLNENPLSELADGEGYVIDNAKLSVAEAKFKGQKAEGKRQNEGLISVYPNPANDVLNVEIVMDNDANNTTVGTCHGMSMEMFTMQGVLISTQNVQELKPGLNRTTLDLRNLPNGAYMLKATVGNQIEARKVIVNR